MPDLSGWLREDGPTILPFLVAALVALAPAFFEIARIFRLSLWQALFSRPAGGLLLLNAVAGFTTYTFARYALDIRSDLVTAAVIGISFPTVLRSQLAVAYTTNDNGRLKAEAITAISGFYQNLLLRQLSSVDTAQALQRMRLVRKLMDVVGADQIAIELQAIINQLQIDDQKLDYQQRLDAQKHNSNQEQQHEALATLLLDILKETAFRQRIREAHQSA